MTSRSPFPGMDPWLEQYWGDVHHSLVTYAADILNERLPRGLVARVRVREFAEPWEDRRGFHPVRAADDHVRQGSVSILDLDSGQVVTWIEFLRYGNKVGGDGQAQFLATRGTLLADRRNFVQIDLLRSGNAMPIGGETAGAPGDCSYSVITVRAGSAPTAEVFGLRDRLPLIRVPLREMDDDVLLDLAGLVDLAYRRGRYWMIDYAADPYPPLEADDAAWADQLLRGKGLRN